jgi:hypothetical protein
MTERLGATDAPPPPPPPPPPDTGPQDQTPEVNSELADALAQGDQQSTAAEQRSEPEEAGEQPRPEAPVGLADEVPAPAEAPGTGEGNGAWAEPGAADLPRPEVDPDLRSALEDGMLTGGPSADQDAVLAADAVQPGDAASVEDQEGVDGVSNIQDDSSVSAWQRETWEADTDGTELPPSMTEDLHNLGKDLNNVLDPADWAKADVNGRKEMLNDVNGRVREEFGLPEQNLNYRSDMPDGLLGQMNSKTGTIDISSALLDSADPKEAIKTVAHENFHCYQEQAMRSDSAEPYAQSRKEAWLEGAANYNSNDYEEYMNNPLEKDAYAVEAEVYAGYLGG